MINVDIINKISEVTKLEFEDAAGIYGFFLSHTTDQDTIRTTVDLLEDCIVNQRELDLIDAQNYSPEVINLLVELDKASS